jgi:hypothetical protein
MPKALELGHAVTLSDAEQQSAAGNHVERRGRLGHAQRMRQRQDEAGGAEITAGTVGGQPRQRRERVEHLVRRPERVVVGGKDPVEAALVRRTGHRPGEFERLGCVHLTGVHRPDIDAELQATTSR